ncbi:unnamed protein product [Pleuronectes platessa]|uniref:Uncharacterized protein n=1 Tax=Pleuronectes platessa TaxID=8262 RepID=A0A9N7YQW7_PLEPL|nr:unnamed protein product [Pleuronectes platessa]
MELLQYESLLLGLLSLLSRASPPPRRLLPPSFLRGPHWACGAVSEPADRWRCGVAQADPRDTISREEEEEEEGEGKKTDWVGRSLFLLWRKNRETSQPARIQTSRFTASGTLLLSNIPNFP